MVWTCKQAGLHGQAPEVPSGGEPHVRTDRLQDTHVPAASLRLLVTLPPPAEMGNASAAPFPSPRSLPAGPICIVVGAGTRSAPFP